MISIECDKCEKTFEVDDSNAGGKVECPHCGDMNRVPEAAASTQASGEDLPDEDGPEKEIIVIRPAMFRAHPFKYMLVMFILIASLVLAGFGFFSGIGIFFGWLGLVVAAADGVYLLHWWVMTSRYLRVSVSNKRTIRHEGIIRRHTTEVLHDHVRSVDIQQTLLQRIFNVGYIGIDSAGQDGIEIEIRDIPGPHRVKEVIDRYRKM